MKARFSISLLFLLMISLNAQTNVFMPVPANVDYGKGKVYIDTSFTVSFTGFESGKVKDAADRMLERLYLQTGLLFEKQFDNNKSSVRLVINITEGETDLNGYNIDESYSLDIAPGNISLSAGREAGIFRGLETFLQSVKLDDKGFYADVMKIEDSPRYPWRGLLIDVSRHWMPMDVIKRHLDAMAALKLNVLHLHLTEDQGFRIESKIYPELHQQGSDGNYFTQEEMKEIISYAADRAIRVVPEFDMPGHTTSWFVSHPELASQPGPYEIDRTWGIKDPSMDPTKESTYELIDNFLGEMAALFPDPYMHIGGDEVTGKQWDNNPDIQKFMKENNIADNHELQVHFNKRVQKILEKHGKIMIGWDEIYRPGLPQDIVIQSWRGHKTLARSAKEGYKSILSFGYYLDHMRSAGYHYSIDPLNAVEFTDTHYRGDEEVSYGIDEMNSLTENEKENILGGEACMWAEFITPQTVDSRLYPRLAAIAERLWSPVSETNSYKDMYRRLEHTSRWLEYTGVNHKTNYRKQLERLAGDIEYAPVKTFIDAVEPVKMYNRVKVRKYTQFTPLNRPIDVARPESDTVRVFVWRINDFLLNKNNEVLDTLKATLVSWKDNYAKMKKYLDTSALLSNIGEHSENLSKLGEIGLAAINAIESGENYTPSKNDLVVIEDSKTMREGIFLPAAWPVEALVKYAAGE